MSKIHTDHVFTSESVSEGHPDKVCDQISDAILDACLMQDPDSRVACETLTTTNLVVISGEITTKAKINWQEIALDAVRKIGYNDPNVGFCADEAKVMVCVHKQSPDISQGVTEGQGMFTEQGAGDQGMMSVTRRTRLRPSCRPRSTTRTRSSKSWRASATPSLKSTVTCVRIRRVRFRSATPRASRSL